MGKQPTTEGQIDSSLIEHTLSLSPEERIEAHEAVNAFSREALLTAKEIAECGPAFFVILETRARQQAAPAPHGNRGLVVRYAEQEFGRHRARVSVFR